MHQVMEFIPKGRIWLRWIYLYVYWCYCIAILLVISVVGIYYVQTVNTELKERVVSFSESQRNSLSGNSLSTKRRLSLKFDLERVLYKHLNELTAYHQHYLKVWGRNDSSSTLRNFFGWGLNANVSKKSINMHEASNSGRLRKNVCVNTFNRVGKLNSIRVH